MTGRGAGDRCRRVGHSIIKAGADLEPPGERLDGADWDMVELDVLAIGDELVVAHDPSDLAHPRPIRFADALAGAARSCSRPTVALDVDVKGTGYELAVLETLRAQDLVPRTLVSTMEAPSLRVLRAAEPTLRLGLSVPKARRDYLSHPLTRPAAYVMLAYLRQVLPGQATARAELRPGRRDHGPLGRRHPGAGAGRPRRRRRSVRVDGG